MNTAMNTDTAAQLQASPLDPARDLSLGPSLLVPQSTTTAGVQQ